MQRRPSAKLCRNNRDIPERESVAHSPANDYIVAGDILTSPQSKKPANYSHFFQSFRALRETQSAMRLRPWKRQEDARVGLLRFRYQTLDHARSGLALMVCHE